MKDSCFQVCLPLPIGWPAGNKVHKSKPALLPWLRVQIVDLSICYITQKHLLFMKRSFYASFFSNRGCLAHPFCDQTISSKWIDDMGKLKTKS